jgi:hypothetical protein
MNKQEAIEKIKNDNSLQGGLVEKSRAIYCIEQIQEPKKVVVPNFVAERLEKNKRHYKKWDEEARADFVIRYISDLFRFGEGLNPWYFTIDEKFSEWTNKSAYEFIIAILFGYEVEKEPLYTVEIPDPNSYVDYRYLSRNDNGICLDASNDTKWKRKKRNQLTEAEIKQDFEWAWQFALEVE